MDATLQLPGTYALMLRNRRAQTVQVGALGAMRIVPGVYVYVGSAFGPGGLRGRLSRHVATNKIERWHIDYLRPRTSLACAWFSTSEHHLEHDWARRISSLRAATAPLPRFGASDCRCHSHLFHFSDVDSSDASIGCALAVTAGESLGRLDGRQLRGLAKRG